MAFSPTRPLSSTLAKPIASIKELIQTADKQNEELNQEQGKIKLLSANAPSESLKSMPINEIVILAVAIFSAVAAIVTLFTWVFVPLSALAGSLCLAAALVVTIAAGGLFYYLNSTRNKILADYQQSLNNHLEAFNKILILVKATKEKLNVHFNELLATDDYKWSDDKRRNFELFGKYCTGLKISSFIQFGVDALILENCLDEKKLSLYPNLKKKIQDASNQVKPKTPESILKQFVPLIRDITGTNPRPTMSPAMGFYYVVPTRTNTPLDSVFTKICNWLNEDPPTTPGAMWGYIDIVGLVKCCPNLESVEAKVPISAIFQKVFEKFGKEQNPQFKFKQNQEVEDNHELECLAEAGIVVDYYLNKKTEGSNAEESQAEGSS